MGILDMFSNTFSFHSQERVWLLLGACICQSSEVKCTVLMMGICGDLLLDLLLNVDISVSVSQKEENELSKFIKLLQLCR